MNNISDDQLTGKFCEYLIAMDSEDSQNFADFHWYDTPNSVDGSWFIYYQMLGDFSVTLANGVNLFGYNCKKIKAWASVLDNCDQDLKDRILLEFVEPICSLALNLPYAIKQRYIFAVSHLCHQANRAIFQVWRDDLVADGSINFQTAKHMARKWNSAAEFFKEISGLFDKNHEAKTNEFRHSFNHRMPSQQIIGYSAFVRRVIKEKGVQYDFGQYPPLNLFMVSHELNSQFINQLKVMEAFKALVFEQLKVIAPLA